MRCDAKNTRIYNGLRMAAVLMLVTACLFVSNGSAIAEKKKSTIMVFSLDDPAPFFSSPDQLIGLSSEADLELDYSNIEAFTEYESYNMSVEQIWVIIRNNNPGKAFYYLTAPFIERKTNDSWIRLNYQSPAIGAQQWFCAVQSNSDKPIQSRLLFESVYLRDKLIPGEYRMVAFVGNLKTYAPFSIV
jgi:hypothetical protein